MNKVQQELWERILVRLFAQVGKEEYRAWLEPIKALEVDHEARSMVLGVATDFFRRWIQEKYLDMIRETMRAEAGGNWVIDIEVQAATNAPITELEDEDTNDRNMAPFSSAMDDVTPSSSRPNQVLARSGLRPAQGPNVITHRGAAPQPVSEERSRLNPRYIFDEYVVGESNRFAHAAAQSVADPDSEAFNPLFLYSPSGLGKTHLMQAVGHAFVRRRRGIQVLYVTSEQFLNSFIESLQSKRSLSFRHQYRNIDLLLLDDVQFLLGKERVQEEVFHTFNALFDAGKKIVLTSDRPPKELATLEERLRSRFEWGVVADIQPPDLETRIAILSRKARNEGLRVPTDVLQYIAECVKTNIRELEGALKRIKVYSGLHNAPITLDMAREVLSHLMMGQPQSRVAVEEIQRVVCEYFEITQVQLISANRSKRFSKPRHVALYLSRELTDLSFPDIAQKFGGRDHTSVIYACRRIKEQVETDTAMAGIVQYLTRQVQRGQGG